MDFYDAVRRRRMVRNYTDEPVDPAAIDRIVDAGRRTPSAGFSQGVAFVVVTDTGKRTQIARLANEEAYVAKGLDPWISRAPVHIVLCVSEDAYHRRYREDDKINDDGTEIEWPVPYWWVDAGAAMQNMLVAAVAEGLAAGFLGAHAAPEIGAMLGIPDEYSIVGIITIGHSAPDRRSGSLQRGWRDRSTVVHHDTWAGGGDSRS